MCIRDRNRRVCLTRPTSSHCCMRRSPNAKSERLGNPNQYPGRAGKRAGGLPALQAVTNRIALPARGIARSTRVRIRTDGALSNRSFPGTISLDIRGPACEHASRICEWRPIGGGFPFRASWCAEAGEGQAESCVGRFTGVGNSLHFRFRRAPGALGATRSLPRAPSQCRSRATQYRASRWPNDEQYARRNEVCSCR